MRRLFFALAITGCATAGPDNSGVGGRTDAGPGGTMKDGSVVVQPDAAPLPDAPPGKTTVTLSQTNNNTVAPVATVACGSALGTSDNSWYRVFKLSDYGINGAFDVTRVEFMVDYAYAGVGTTQPATIKVGTYSGTVEANTLNPAQVTPLTQKAITIPDGDSEVAIPPPVVTDIATTVPAGSNLIVELALPNGTADGNFFYIGVSTAGENKKGYIRATPSGCNMTVPTSLVGQLNQPTNSILLTVTGTY